MVSESSFCIVSRRGKKQVGSCGKGRPGAFLLMAMAFMMFMGHVSFISPSQVLGGAAGMLLAASGTAANAADVPPMPPTQMQKGAPSSMQMQQAAPSQRVTGRVTFSRLEEFIEENSVLKIDFYDMGRTAVALIQTPSGQQQLVCDLPGTTTALIAKLTAKNVSMEVHAPEKPNPVFDILGSVAFPLLILAGLLLLRRNSPGGGGMPGMPGQKQAKVQSRSIAQG